MELGSGASSLRAKRRRNDDARPERVLRPRRAGATTGGSGRSNGAGRGQELDRPTASSLGTVNGAAADPVERRAEEESADTRPVLEGSTALPIEATILRLLAARKDGATICPSEVARALAKDWRPLMDPVRTVASDLVDRGLIVVTQKGQIVDLRTAKGPIRLRKR
ncbi:hypothetical protein DFJ74DRAFT_441239 [Hyaloraphidium curvatum]|nr:hypothetical protein DFJ74DRAFT_441239 [Hyaloraphidium curvatum]